MTRTSPTSRPLATVRDIRGRNPGRYLIARAYLDAGAAGLPCAELAVELARAVLGHPEVQLALNVLEGGPFAHARATELACRLLEFGDTGYSVAKVNETRRGGRG